MITTNITTINTAKTIMIRSWWSPRLSTSSWSSSPPRTGPEERVCQATGIWSNQEPYCKKKGPFLEHCIVAIYMQKSWPKTLKSYGLKLQPDASINKFKISATIPVHSDHRHVLISAGVDFPLIREKSPESGLFLISLRTGPPSSQRFRHNPTLIHGKEKKKTKTKTEPMM